MRSRSDQENSYRKSTDMVAYGLIAFVVHEFSNAISHIKGVLRSGLPRGQSHATSEADR